MQWLCIVVKGIPNVLAAFLLDIPESMAFIAFFNDPSDHFPFAPFLMYFRGIFAVQIPRY